LAPSLANDPEWLDALKAVELHRGQERLRTCWSTRLVDQARRDGLYIPRSLTTAYKNTIPPEQEAQVAR
jgi:pyruvate dehydrogenase E1 component